MGLESLLAARRKEKEDIRKVPDPYEMVFSSFERGVLAQFNSERGQVYKDWFLGKPMVPHGGGRGSEHSYVKEGMEGRELHEAQAAQKQTETRGPSTYTGPRLTHPVTKEYADTLIDESDRWKKTGSRWVIPSTEQSRRKEHMGKRYTGNLQGMSGVKGPATVQKKKLLGA